MTQSGVPHGEGWILEIAITFHLGISNLTRSDESIRNWLNRGSHELSPPELRKTLRRLFDNRDLEAFYPDDDTYLCPSDERFFCPSDGQLDAALRGEDNRLAYRLTIQGASRWEKLANPNWARYFEQSSVGDNTYEVIAGSRERLLELVRESKTLWQVTISATDLDIQALRPWRVKHWKTFPVGYRVLAEYFESPWLGESDAVMEYMRQTPEERKGVLDAHWQRYIRIWHWADSICGYKVV